MTRYVIVSPVKNEGAFIEDTLRSVVEQTMTPSKWVIVNDGSTDNTSEIVTRYCAKYDFITLLERPIIDLKRRRGQGVVEAFYDGFELIKDESYDFVVKLDGDLILPRDFFESIIVRFQKDTSLGIASGISFTKKNDEWVREPAARGYTYGETKVYRRRCFADIGGLMATMGWDGIDHIKAVMKGWKATSFDDIRFFHLRPEGQGSGRIRAAYEEGFCCYFMGYHPLFLLLRAFKKMGSQPIVIGGLTILFSYLLNTILRKARIDDQDFISYLRKTQLRRIWTRGAQYA